MFSNSKAKALHGRQRRPPRAAWVWWLLCFLAKCSPKRRSYCFAAARQRRTLCASMTFWGYYAPAKCSPKRRSYCFAAARQRRTLCASITFWGYYNTFPRNRKEFLFCIFYRNRVFMHQSPEISKIFSIWKGVRSQNHTDFTLAYTIYFQNKYIDSLPQNPSPGRLSVFWF